MAQQLKGVVMPYVESQKGEKAMKVTTKAKRFAAYGALRRVGVYIYFFIRSSRASGKVIFKIFKCPGGYSFLFFHRNAPWHATGVSVPRRPRKPQRMLLLLARSKMYHHSKPRKKIIFLLSLSN